MSPYLNYKDFLIERYGEALYRIPVDFGFGCTNRPELGSGAKAPGGCTFCPVDGARAQQTLYANTIAEQVSEAIDFAKRRYRARKFMAYIQAYTATFASVLKQRERFSQVLAQFEFEALSIGTRPDCLSSATVEYLVELNQHCEVWVELGVQTSHDETLKRINRGHSWECSRDAILRLSHNKLNVIVHVILGLPGESESDFLLTAERLAQLPISGIKLHNLHIVKDTQLAVEFANAPFPLMDEHEYCIAAIEFLRRIPRHIPVVRLQTDTPPEQLIAPIWNLSKAQFISMVIRQMLLSQVQQGDLCVSHSPSKCLALAKDNCEVGQGADSVAESDSSHAQQAATSSRKEARSRFVGPSGLNKLIHEKSVKILDVGFGDAAKTLEAVSLVRSMSCAHSLEIHAFEIDRNAFVPRGNELLESLLERGFASGDFGSIHLHWGDVRHTIKQAREEGPFDLVFLDGGGIQSNTELWTVDFFKTLRVIMGPEGKLLTHNTSLPVLSGLMMAGFCVGLTAHNYELENSELQNEDFKKGVIAWVLAPELLAKLSSTAKVDLWPAAASAKSKKSSTYPRGYACGFFDPASLPRLKSRLSRDEANFASNSIPKRLPAYENRGI